MGGVYIDYEIYKCKYLEIQIQYNEILTEKENLFTKTQPNAIRYDKVQVQGGTYGNGFDEYLIAKEKEQIDERLAEARQLLEDRERLLKLKEKELRASKDKLDLIYCMRYVDNKRPYAIARCLNYSESQIYRILDKIQKEIRREK
jgi:DNA-directed RNA polymerase specialized sigma subunit